MCDFRDKLRVANPPDGRLSAAWRSSRALDPALSGPITELCTGIIRDTLARPVEQRNTSHKSVYDYFMRYAVAASISPFSDIPLSHALSVTV